MNTQLNALGAFENLVLFDEDGNRVYEFITTSDGHWGKFTFDSNGNELTYENSYGYWNKRTYDSNGKELTFENSYGYWSKYTRDSKGKELTYDDSGGVRRVFNTPEHTMDELVEKLGYDFKIKK
jgi:hypothetical protein